MQALACSKAEQYRNHRLSGVRAWPADVFNPPCDSAAPVHRVGMHVQGSACWPHPIPCVALSAPPPLQDGSTFVNSLSAFLGAIVGLVLLAGVVAFAMILPVLLSR